MKLFHQKQEIKKNHIFLGKNIFQKECFHESAKDLVAIFPARSGFSSGIVIPTLLKNMGNIVVINLQSPEYFHITSQKRREEGHTILNIRETTTQEEILNTVQSPKFTIYLTIPIILTQKGQKVLEKHLVFLEEALQKESCLIILDDCFSLWKKTSAWIFLRGKHKFLIRVQNFEETITSKIFPQLAGKYDFISVEYPGQSITLNNNKKYHLFPYFRWKNFSNKRGE